MQSITNPSFTLLISLSVLSGWVVNDYRVCDTVQTAVASSTKDTAYFVNEASMKPATTHPHPDILVNWFSGNVTPTTGKMPLPQPRKDDDDERVAVGGTLGESFSNSGDY